jgi:hypothetical protein
MSLLAHTAAQGHLSVVHLLLAAGADVQSKDLRGWAPLNWPQHCDHDAVRRSSKTRWAKESQRETLVVH